MKGERKMQKEKLFMLFSDHKASQILTKTEIQAICEFLSGQVPLFSSSKLKREYLEELVGMSEVYEIEATSDLLIEDSNTKKLEANEGLNLNIEQ